MYFFIISIFILLSFLSIYSIYSFVSNKLIFFINILSSNILFKSSFCKSNLKTFIYISKVNIILNNIFEKFDPIDGTSFLK